MIYVTVFVFQVAVWAGDGDAVFIREYTLIRRDHLSEEPLPVGGQKPEDPVSSPLTFNFLQIVS